MIEKLPDWIGTAPQWGLFVIILLTIIKLVPTLRAQNFAATDSHVKHFADLCTEYKKEVTGLREELQECEETCRREIKRLHEEIFGLRTNNVQEQISLISAIIHSVEDSPELKRMLNTLESVQMALGRAKVLQSQVGTVIQKTDKPEGEKK